MSFFNPDKFNILLVIDGSEESHRGLRYAERVGRGNDADITLLYVRPIDKAKSMAGIDMRTVRQNMLDWGLELPGMKALETTRQMLLESGYMSDAWKSEAAQREVSGDPLGDQFVNYTSENGARITLKLIVRKSLADGILDECDRYDYDLTILALSGKDSERGLSINWPVSRRILDEYTGTVLVARGIDVSHGHLICVLNNDASIMAARKDAVMASKYNAPIFLLSVAKTEEDKADAEQAIERATQVLAEENIHVVEAKVRVGDPKEIIIRQGKTFSVIVLADPHVKGLSRFFSQSIGMQVLKDAQNSVMIAR